MRHDDVSLLPLKGDLRLKKDRLLITDLNGAIIHIGVAVPEENKIAAIQHNNIVVRSSVLKPMVEINLPTTKKYELIETPKATYIMGEGLTVPQWAVIPDAPPTDEQKEKERLLREQAKIQTIYIPTMLEGSIIDPEAKRMEKELKKINALLAANPKPDAKEEVAADLQLYKDEPVVEAPKLEVHTEESTSTDETIEPQHDEPFVYNETIAKEASDESMATTSVEPTEEIETPSFIIEEPIIEEAQSIVELSDLVADIPNQQVMKNKRK
jgi:hypothetical protein